MTISTLIDLNPTELNQYPFMISFDKCNGHCNTANDLPTKLCVTSETKEINVEVFNIQYLIED